MLIEWWLVLFLKIVLSSRIQVEDIGTLAYDQILRRFGPYYENTEGDYLPLFTLFNGKVCKEEQFETIEVLGVGSRGCVQQVRHLETGRMFAAKYYNPENTSNSAILMEEVILHKLTHPNLPQGICTFHDTEGKVVTVMTLGPRRSLRSWLEEEGATPRSDLQKIATQMTDVLVYLNGKKIIHNDVKPENILWTADGSIMLIDFDLAVYVLEKATGVRGTLIYMALEKLLNWKYDNGVDWYALGVVLTELYLGKHPFGTYGNFHQLSEAVEKGFDKLEDDELDEVVANLCESVAEDRWSLANNNIDQLKGHPFLKNQQPSVAY